jgi:hypothetical protein
MSMSAFVNAPEAGSHVIAQCRTPNGNTLIPIAGDEIDRLRNWLAWQLRPFDLKPGSTVLQILSTGAIWPLASLQKALLDGMLLPTFAESSPFDWYRVAAILRQFELAAVFDLNAEMLAMLEENSPESIDLLRKVPVVFADPVAKVRLAALDIAAYSIVNLGPTLAMECPLRTGLHVDGREWRVREQDGEIRVTSLLPRLHPFNDFATGFNGSVERAACRCASPDWRILI